MVLMWILWEDSTMVKLLSKTSQNRCGCGLGNYDIFENYKNLQLYLRIASQRLYPTLA